MQTVSKKWKTIYDKILLVSLVLRDFFLSVINKLISTFLLHSFHGQYTWSMTIGLLTFFMIISSKCISDAEPPNNAGQDLILTPFWVLEMVQFLTKIPDTDSSFWDFPKLPMLMPWPGAHVTPSIVICLLPWPREIQSSPVPMSESIILMSFDRPIWIPSVFRLSSCAVIVKCWKVRFLHPKRWAWKYLLSVDVISWTIPLVMKLNFKLWSIKQTKTTQN